MHGIMHQPLLLEVMLFRSHFRLSQFVKPSLIDGINNSDNYVKIAKFIHLKITKC